MSSIDPASAVAPPQMIDQVDPSIIEQYGLDAVGAALNNLFGEKLVAALHKKIDESSMPQFQKDEAKAAVTASFQANQQQVDPAAQEAVNGAVGGDMQSMVDEMLMESVNEQLQDEAGAEESGSAGGKGGEGGGGNWLVTLAKALGKMSGEHLDKMVELGKKMGAMGEESAGAMAEANAEFQAEAQMFKMLQESISTMLKSIGEGMSSVARKQ